MLRSRPSVWLEASKTDATTRNPGNSVRMEEYAAPLARRNCPCWNARQNDRRIRVKCMNALRVTKAGQRLNLHLLPQLTILSPSKKNPVAAENRGNRPDKPCPRLMAPG